MNFTADREKNWTDFRICYWILVSHPMKQFRASPIYSQKRHVILIEKVWLKHGCFHVSLILTSMKRPKKLSALLSDAIYLKFVHPRQNVNVLIGKVKQSLTGCELSIVSCYCMSNRWYNVGFLWREENRIVQRKNPRSLRSLRKKQHRTNSSSKSCDPRRNRLHG